MERINEIIAGQGLGVVKFGMTREQVTMILGKADEEEQFSYSDEDDDLTEAWHYDEHDISLTFDQQELWRLVTIAVSGGDYKFQGKNLIGLDSEALVITLQELGHKNLETEDVSDDETPNHIVISHEESGMVFWLENNEVTEIQFGPMFVNEETIDWPL